MTVPPAIFDADANRLLEAMVNIENAGFPAATAAFWAAGEGWTRDHYAAVLASLEERGLVAKGPKS